MKHIFITFICAIQTIMFWVLIGSLFSDDKKTLLIIILIVLLLLSCIGSTKYRLFNQFKIDLFGLELLMTPIAILRQLVFAIIKLIDKPGFIVNENTSCLEEALTKKQKITQFLFCFYYEDPIK